MKKFIAALLFSSVAMVSVISAKPNVNANAVALEGHDPVAFFTDAKPVKGSLEFTAVHDGAIYLFASAEHRDRFVAMPAKYAPQYGGYCAYGVTKGAKFPVEIATWQILDGRLFLNKNASVQSTFNKDAAGYILVADQQWPALK